jgi:hypothetical protein
MIVNPFYPFNNRPRLRAMVVTLEQPLMYRLVLQIWRILLCLWFIPWHIALWQLQYATGRTTIARTANTRDLVFCANCKKSVVHFPRLWQFAIVLCPICHGQGSRSRVVAKSAKSGEPVFTSMDVLRTVALRRPICQQKKQVLDNYFRPKLLIHGLISTTILWHCPFQHKLVSFLKRKKGLWQKNRCDIQACDRTVCRVGWVDF